ncbi:MAG: LysM peptidoglycan-binding domain-containing protein [Anaerolineales bacterium]|jgi:LysM repeat protein
MTIKNTINSYRKRQQLLPVIIGIAALLLVIVGIIIVVVALSGTKGGWNPFASKTPTPTASFTPTNTPLPTDTATITLTPTLTATGTPSAPYVYTVKQGDSLYKLAQDNNLGDYGIVLILMLNPSIDPITGSIQVGQKINMPNPGMHLPTATAWATNAPPGTHITYFVMPGDSLNSIAAKLNSTTDAIIAANKTLLPKGLSTVLSPGWLLIVPVNLVTPVPTLRPTGTATPAFTATLGSSATATP